MNVFRTILWVLILVGLILFSLANWNPGISVRIWSNLVVDTRLPAVVVISFLAGLVPMWLYHRGMVWSLTRRLRALETAAVPASSGVRSADLRDSTPAAPLAPAESEPQRPARPTDGLDAGPLP